MIFDPRQKIFSHEQANRALAFVRPVVKDILRKRDLFYEVQKKLERDQHNQFLIDACTNLSEQIIHDIREVESTGAIFKDVRIGLVDFPAVIDGYEAYYCWSFGENSVCYWHDLENGFDQRRALTNVAY